MVVVVGNHLRWLWAIDDESWLLSWVSGGGGFQCAVGLLWVFKVFYLGYVVGGCFRFWWWVLI